ncbi:MAG: hypothetical protein D6B25_03835 [Desulfobulbaceae bacterium]|nr:MAG: hypothetical protein D6B25_03835 [Desulfobulbaceae bacterium]
MSAFVMLSLLFIMSSCAHKEVAGPTDEERQVARTQYPCLTVLPVNTTVNSVPDMSYQEAARLEEGARYLDSVITQLLNGKKNVRVLSDRQLTAVIAEDSASALAMIRKIGAELNCDAVMITTLKTYQQRVGGSYGAEVPASAFFSLKVFDVKDGRIIWSAMFKETQQSLLSNLASFNKAQNRGFKWITVEELAKQGMAEKLEQCPYF